MSPLALAALFLAIAAVALGVIAYAALRLYLDRSGAEKQAAIAKEDAEVRIRAHEAAVKRLREDVDFLRMRAGLG